MKKIETETFIVNPDIEEYLRNLAPVDDKILEEMEVLGREGNFPIIGPLVGKLLYQFTVMIGAKKVFEMGSGFGYSAYWLAKGLKEGGKITCVEGDEENVLLAKGFFKKGGMEERAQFHKGDALKIVEKTKGSYDIIFNDVDKEQYPGVFHKALPKLRKGGLLISDNLLWDGKVLSKNPDEETRGIQEFTQLIYRSRELFSSILPLRDGISVSIKI